MFYFTLFSLFATITAPLALKDESMIEEQAVKQFNQKLWSLRQSLKEKYELASSLQIENTREKEYESLLDQIRQLKADIRMLEEEWRYRFIEEVQDFEEGYALWDQGETTLSQLIMEYGGADYVYIIPQELGSLKIHLFSSVGVPRECWDDLIEMILSQNGIGIKKLNAYVKQLYTLKHHPAHVAAVVSRRKDLEFLKDHERICFIFSPEKPDQVRSVLGFFEKFSDPKQTTLQSIGSKIVLVAAKENIDKLLALYDAVWESNEGKALKVIPLKKIATEEAERVLKSFFSESQAKSRAPFYLMHSEELLILNLANALVVAGDDSSVKRAEKILMDLENQINDPSEMTVYWYACQHSDPEEVASILGRVYSSFSSVLPKAKDKTELPSVAKEENTAHSIATPPKVLNTKNPHEEENFIVDPKSGSILMVVRKEELKLLLDLLKKIDVPKKMVQIDVLLVEKKFVDRKQAGMNLLKIGTSSGKKETAISYDLPLKKGLLDFILGRPKGKLPALDLTYSFLLAQENMKIKANPSVLAMNQTAATISIVEEISINTGAILDTTKVGAVEKSYTRASYGTTIVMTPTIHWGEEGGFVTLQTNITFDTTQMKEDDRPNVTRRHVQNEVRIANGETIILGGLRRSSQENNQEKIPFLGDIPGIGKLFGTTKESDTNTEMFIFITPHIIRDPVEDLRSRREEELKKRSGDIPEFLHCLGEAKKNEQKHFFEDSLKLLFDAK